MYESCIEFMKNKKLPEASSCFSELLATSPDSVNALYYLGLIEAELGDPIAAAHALGQVVDLDPEDIQAHEFLIGQLLAAGRVKDAIFRARAADDLFPHHLAFKVFLIRAYHKNNDLEDATLVREELFRLRNEENVTDGLESTTLYLRDKFTVNRYTVYAVEYFSSSKPEGPSFSLTVKWGEGKERIYRVYYHERMKELVQMELGPDAEPYYLEALDGDQRSTVTAYISQPTYSDVKKAVIQDLTDGRDSFRVRVQGPTSTTPIKE
jgi:tetratricopeptide (TPR) repeat protein